MEETKRKNPIVIWSVVALVIAVASYGVFKYIKRDTSATTTLVESPAVVPENKQIEVTTPITPTTPTPTTSSIYKNGTYSSIGDYFSPGGDEQIGLQVTVEDDVIIDVKVESKATRPNAIKFQGIFISNFKPFVIGKKINDVHLSKVSGSSLTPGGFNDALAKIKAEAKV